MSLVEELVGAIENNVIEVLRDNDIDLSELDNSARATFRDLITKEVNDAASASGDSLRQGNRFAPTLTRNATQVISDVLIRADVNEITTSEIRTAVVDALEGGNNRALLAEIRESRSVPDDEVQQAIDAAQAADPDNIETVENVFDNAASRQERELLQYVDEALIEAEIGNRVQILNNIELGDSELYGTNQMIEISLLNMDSDVDKIISKIINEYAPDKKLVVMVQVMEGIESSHKTGGYPVAVNSLDRKYDSPQEVVTHKTYFPDADDVVQNLFSNWLLELENTLQNNVSPLYRDGPRFSTNTAGHREFIRHLNQATVIPEIKNVLDKATLEGTLLAGNREGGDLDDLGPVYKNGVDKYFKKLQKAEDGDKLTALRKKPSYVLGYTFKAPNGNKHIVSMIPSDGYGRDVGNEVSYTKRNRRASIQTNFFNFNPRAFAGYYPNPYIKNYKIRKLLIQKQANNWYAGLLHLADLDGVILTQSPINGQVANLYQLGGFIFENDKVADERTLAPFEGHGGMIRYPSLTRGVVEEYKAKLNLKTEWMMDRAKSNIVTSRWGSPQSITLVANKRLYTPEQYKFSERHRAIVSIAENYKNYNYSDYQTVNHNILSIAGISGEDSAARFTDHIENSAFDNLRYALKRNEIDRVSHYYMSKVRPEDLARIVLNSSRLEEITGIEIQEVFTYDIDKATEKLLEVKTGRVELEHINGTMTPQAVYTLFEKSMDTLSTEELNSFDVLTITEETPGEIQDYYRNVEETGADSLSETTDIVDEDATRDTRITYESIRQSYNTNPSSFTEDLPGVHRELMQINTNFTGGDASTQRAGFFVFDESITFENPSELAFNFIEPTENGRADAVMTDKARHLFVRNLQSLVENENTKLLTADIEWVGSLNDFDFIEVLTVQEVTENGIPQLRKSFGTYQLLEDVFGISIMSSIETNRRNNPKHVEALTLMFKELDINILQNYSTDSPASRVHPVGMLGTQAGVVDGENSSLLNVPEHRNYKYDDSFRGFLSDSDEILSEFRNLPKQGLIRPTDITPQPVYVKQNFSDIRAGNYADYVINIDETMNDVITKLNDLVDNKIDGAYKIGVFQRNTTNFVGNITKRHGQPIQNLQNINLDEPRLFIANLEITAPQKDFRNGVIKSALNNFDANITGNRVVGSRSNVARMSQYKLNNDGGVVTLIDDDNLPRIRSSYSLGMDIGEGGTDYVGIPFRADRLPVGSNPDAMTLRRIARSFAKTKTGKTLGLAWKTIDIGETLISKAFAKTQAAALAAGATTMGGAAAFAATAWAMYEISNLIVAAGQQVPELYNVFAKRNEILANGEDWEKQIVEETFWQDYGPELLEALQTAGDRSPSEMLSDKIWGFALDNLTRQSQGEVFEDSLIDTSEELDIRDDIFNAKIPSDYKLQELQNNIDYDKVFTGYLNNRPEANVIANRTLQLANEVYNRDR